MRTSITTSLFASILAVGTAFGAASDADARQPGDDTLTSQQVRALLTAEGFTKVDDPEFEDGMWETDATSADGNRVDLKIDPSSGRIYSEDIVSRLSADDVKAKVSAAGYSKIKDVDYDDGVWKAEAESTDGRNVELRIDPMDGRILAAEND